jgi:ubiquitin thioesterase protein OTUB1
LAKKYSGLRRTRPDGNCFYRAVGYRYFEHLRGDADERAKAKKAVEASKETMNKLGFPPFTTEDFRDTFLEQVEATGQSDFSQQNLLDLWRDSGSSDYLVVFLRLLTSAELQERCDFYQPFMEEGQAVKDFCATQVEPMYVESDHLQATALSAALGLTVRIMYLDRGSADEASAHDFGLEETTGEEKRPRVDPKIHLLYRPGHYDVLYPKESTQ